MNNFYNESSKVTKINILLQMLHVLTLSVIAVILRHPELVIEPTAPALPTPQSEYDNSYAPDVHANSSPNAYRKFLVRNNLEYRKLAS